MRKKHRIKLDSYARHCWNVISFKVFDDHCFNGDIVTFIDRLIHYHSELEFMHKYWSLIDKHPIGDIDYRRLDYEHTKRRLNYISDRWNCKSRVAYLMQLYRNIRFNEKVTK